jgi:hypothetical protein
MPCAGAPAVGPPRMQRKSTVHSAATDSEDIAASEPSESPAPTAQKHAVRSAIALVTLRPTRVVDPKT